MARIRTIKPEFWGDEKLGPLSPIDRLVFLGLISMADDAGRTVDSVRAVDGFVFAVSKSSARRSLERLVTIGVIARGLTESGQPIIQIVNWNKHQKVDKPNRAASLPPILAHGDSRAIREPLANQSRTSRESVAIGSRPDLRSNDLRSTTSDLRSSESTDTPRARDAPPPHDQDRGVSPGRPEPTNANGTLPPIAEEVEPAEDPLTQMLKRIRTNGPGSRELVDPQPAGWPDDPHRWQKVESEIRSIAPPGKAEEWVRAAADVPKHRRDRVYESAADTEARRKTREFDADVARRDLMAALSARSE